MIRPNVRASFGRREAEFLLALAGPEGEARLREGGIDALLDDARVVRRMLQRGGIDLAPAPLVFYLLVRQALLEREIHDRQLADYTAAVLLEFGRIGRKRASEAYPETIYLADILDEIDRARGEREFALRAHLGNVALWIGGVFPDFVTARVQRRGSPPITYYDEVGAAGFRSAASMEWALRYDLGDLFLTFADEFTNVRSALNGLSDALFFPYPSDAVERVLREVSDRFRRHGGG
jgi:cytidine deaminase